MACDRRLQRPWGAATLQRAGVWPDRPQPDHPLGRRQSLRRVCGDGQRRRNRSGVEHKRRRSGPPATGRRAGRLDPVQPRLGARVDDRSAWPCEDLGCWRRRGVDGACRPWPRANGPARFRPRWSGRLRARDSTPLGGAGIGRTRHVEQHKRRGPQPRPAAERYCGSERPVQLGHAGDRVLQPDASADTSHARSDRKPARGRRRRDQRGCEPDRVRRARRCRGCGRLRPAGRAAPQSAAT